MIQFRLQFENIDNGTKQKMKIKLIFGTSILVDWTDYGPIGRPESVLGYKITELINNYQN